MYRISKKYSREAPVGGTDKYIKLNPNILFGTQSNIQKNMKTVKEIEKILNTELDKTDTDRPSIECVSDIPTYLAYAPGRKIKKPNNHNGQRKLALSEIQFLTKSISEYRDVKICLYVGSAPSNKTFMLAELFPTIKFILIDPNKFRIMIPDAKGRLISHRRIDHPDIIHMNSMYPSDSIAWKGKSVFGLNDIDDNEIEKMINFTVNDTKHRIYIIEDYFTAKLADLYEKTGVPMFFISDIRSNVQNATTPMDIDIVWNSSLVFNWMSKIKPARSMIKFRIPFMGDDSVKKTHDQFELDFAESKDYGIDFVADHLKKKFVFPKGKLYIQAWQPKSSTELRIHIDKSDLATFTEYDPTRIEGLINYYNLIERTYITHHNPNSSMKLCFCKCNDCGIENRIWSDYVSQINDDHSVLYHVKNMDVITGRPLCKMHKNTIYSRITQRKIDKIINNINLDYGKTTVKYNKGNRGRPTKSR